MYMYRYGSFYSVMIKGNMTSPAPSVSPNRGLHVARVDLHMELYMELHMELHMDLQMDLHMEFHMELHMELHVDLHMELHMDLDLDLDLDLERLDQRVVDDAAAGRHEICCFCCSLASRPTTYIQIKTKQMALYKPVPVNWQSLHNNLYTYDYASVHLTFSCM